MKQVHSSHRRINEFALEFLGKMSFTLCCIKTVILGKYSTRHNLENSKRLILEQNFTWESYGCVCYIANPDFQLFPTM